MPTLHCKHCIPLQALHPTAGASPAPDLTTLIPQPHLQNGRRRYSPNPPHWTPPFPFKLEATFSDREAERRMGKVGWQSPFAS